MVFENILTRLEPEEIIAVLSALVFQEKAKNISLDDMNLTPRLRKAQVQVTRLAEALAVIQLECGVDLANSSGTGTTSRYMHYDAGHNMVQDYVSQTLNWGIFEVVYEWARGMDFKHIMNLTDIQEGSIVRTIVRLDETCREVRNIARIIGNPSLYQKMELASESIKRDV